MGSDVVAPTVRGSIVVAGAVCGPRLVGHLFRLKYACSKRRLSLGGVLKRLRSTNGIAALTGCLAALSRSDLLNNLRGFTGSGTEGCGSVPGLVICGATLLDTASKFSFRGIFAGPGI